MILARDFHRACVAVSFLLAGLLTAMPLSGQATPEERPQPEAAKEDRIKVPMNDARMLRNEEELRTSAALASGGGKGGFLLVIMGRNQALLDETKEATRAAIRQGLPPLGIMVGPTHLEEEVILYDKGQPVSRPGRLRNRRDMYDAIAYRYGEQTGHEVVLYHDLPMAK